MDTQHWTQQIDSTTRDFVDNFKDLSEKELNWKPSASAWSIAQNVHHLITINQTYNPVVKSVREGSYQLPWIGKWRFMVNFFGNTVLKSVGPDRQRRMKTFPLWEPSMSNIDGNILEQFKIHQEELKDLIQSSADLLDRDVIVSSPANKNIVYTLKCAFDIIVTHERRHLNQAKEVNELRKKN